MPLLSFHADSAHRPDVPAVAPPSRLATKSSASMMTSKGCAGTVSGRFGARGIKSSSCMWGFSTDGAAKYTSPDEDLGLYLNDLLRNSLPSLLVYARIPPIDICSRHPRKFQWTYHQKNAGFRIMFGYPTSCRHPSTFQDRIRGFRSHDPSSRAHCAWENHFKENVRGIGSHKNKWKRLHHDLNEPPDSFHQGRTIWGCTGRHLIIAWTTS
jgi:hypothetical protein